MRPTEELFREDAYLTSAEAEIVALIPDGGVVLDRTVFYAAGGGQPGDSGRLEVPGGPGLEIATTAYSRETGTLVHVPAKSPQGLEPGQTVHCAIDWDRRYLHMRVHTCLHVLCALLPYPVTGGQIGAGHGRLDFDIPEAGLDKEALTESLNAKIAEDRAVRMRWISDEELGAKPELVRTMAVKPPTGSGRVRLIEIEDCDVQPCGGTHVSSTREIGPVRVTKIEKKGAQNRRVRIELAS